MLSKLIVVVKLLRVTSGGICMGVLFRWMMLALRFVSNHREKPVAARMPPLVMLICAMMASVLGHSKRQWCRESSIDMYKMTVGKESAQNL